MAELDITRGARGNPTIAPHVIPDRALLGTLHELFKQIGCVLYILDTIKSWYDRLPALGTKNARGEASENLGPDRQQRLYEKLYGTTPLY